MSRTNNENYCYITFEATKAFREWLNEQAKKENISRSEYIRKTLTNSTK